MSAVCVNGDYAGGAMIASSSGVTVNGKAIVLSGDSITSHGKAPHSSATINSTYANFLVNGKGVVRAGDVATCGHTASSSVTNFSVG